MLTQAELKEVLDYDPETGIFRWKDSRHNRSKVGSVAGGIRVDGYARITINSVCYLSHRLAWLYVTGDWPTKHIDHINRCPSDNRFENIRQVTNSENGHNRSSPKTKQSNLPLGVCLSSRKNKPYKAQLVVGGKHVLRSNYETQEEAEAAYWEAKAIHHPSSPLISPSI